MPIRNDTSGKRWVEMEILAPGTPEQVWQAMATGAGNTAWFTSTTVEERVSGRIRFDLGANGISEGEVTAWDPPRRFGYVERDWSPGAPPVATEIVITSRSGDQCLVRMVHSLFSSSDEWDDQIEGFERGWPGFFDLLRVYLTHFAGKPAASFHALATVEGDQLATWKRLSQSLGMAGADAGDERTTPPRPEALTGVIERIQQDSRQRYLAVRLTGPVPGAALIATSSAGGAVTAGLSLYFYGDGAASTAAASEPRWQEWFRQTFPAAA